MAVISMDQAIVKIHDGSSLTDYTNNIISAKLNIENTVGSYNTLGEEWEKNTEGNRRWTVELEMEPTDGASGTVDLVNDWMVPASGKPGTRAFEAYIPDENSGSFKYSGNVSLNSVNPVNAAGGSGDPATLTPSLKGDSTLTIATVV